jgi:hypothetical protein
MTLHDYQAGPPLTQRESILLMQGPRFPHELQDAHFLLPERLSSWKRYLERKTKLRFFARPRLKPGQPSLVFVGHADRPFEDAELRRKALAYLGRFHRQRFVVVLGKSCYPPPTEESVPANITRFYATNPVALGARAAYLPLGRDFRSRAVFDVVGPSARKSILLYGNFSLDTHAMRAELAERVAALPFARCEHMGRYLNYSLTREEFFQNVAASKFVLCPRGMGIESYRMWDTLALGSIPIVIREAPFQRQLEDLPILFIDRPEEVSRFTEAELEAIYARMLHRTWNFAKLRLDFWLDQIYAALRPAAA